MARTISGRTTPISRNLSHRQFKVSYNFSRWDSSITFPTQPSHKGLILMMNTINSGLRIKCRDRWSRFLQGKSSTRTNTRIHSWGRVLVWQLNRQSWCSTKMMSQKTLTKAEKTLSTDLKGKSVVTSTCGSRPKKVDLNPENAFKYT